MPASHPKNQNSLSNNKFLAFFRALGKFASTPLARRLVLSLFVVQAVLLVFTIRTGTPPDENNHIRFIEYYVNHSVSPFFTDQTPTVNLGDKTREVDYLYHYAMSWLYRASPLEAKQTYKVIRLLTVFSALLCLLVLANVFRRLGVSDGPVTVGLLVVTNLPMVLMMSSVVNNDVFVWLGMALGFLLLIRLWKQPTATDLVWLGALALLGGLIKRDLLPFGMMFGILGLVIFFRHTRTILNGFKKFQWSLLVGIILLVLGMGLFAERIGGNIVRYHSVAPSCEQVQGAAACSVFWASIREKELAKQPKKPIIPLHQFVDKWFWHSFFNIVDIQTQWWRHQVMPAHWLTPFLITMLSLGLLIGLVYERTRFAAEQLSRWRVYIALIAAYYILVNILVNYGTYMHHRVFGIALNGRYIIPSVIVLAVLACFYWSWLLRRRPALLAALALFTILATILGSGLIMMLRNPQLYLG